MASFLHIGPDAINHRLIQVREKLLSFKNLLPYGSTINAKNAFSHARAITRMSNVLEQQRAAAAAAGDGNDASTAPVVQLAPGELGPASKKLTESQLPALEAAKLEGRISKDGSKRRKRVRFEEEEEKKETREEKPGKSAELEEDEEEEDGLGSDLDASDSELDMYLRSAEEVEAFKEAYEALEEATAGRGGG